MIEDKPGNDLRTARDTLESIGVAIVLAFVLRRVLGGGVRDPDGVDGAAALGAALGPALSGLRDGFRLRLSAGSVKGSLSQLPVHGR